MACSFGVFSGKAIPRTPAPATSRYPSGLGLSFSRFLVSRLASWSRRSFRSSNRQRTTLLLEDWRARRNLTVSHGLRDEVQTSIGDHRDFATRISVVRGLPPVGRAAEWPRHCQHIASATGKRHGRILADLFGIRAKYSKVNPPIALCPDPICKTPLLLRLLSLVFPVFHVCSTPRQAELFEIRTRIPLFPRSRPSRT